MKLMTMGLFLLFFTLSASNASMLEAKSYSKLCLDDIRALNITDELNNIDRAIVMLMKEDYRGVVFAKGTSGRADFYDPKFRTLYSCVYKAKDIVYLDKLVNVVALNKLSETNPPAALNGLGGIVFNFIFSHKELELKDKYVVPDNVDDMLKQLDNRRKMYDKEKKDTQ